MPKGFDSCVRRGGKVRTRRLSGGRYQKLCFIGKKSYGCKAQRRSTSKKRS